MKNTHAVMLLMMLVVSIHWGAMAAILHLEDFSSDVGVTDRDDIMTVGHDGVNDRMSGSFAFQAFSSPQVDAFVINSAPFVGDYVTPGLTQIRFQMFAVNILPSDLFIRIIDGANVFSYQFNPIAGMLNDWETFTVNLAWSFGWGGPSEAAFNAALNSVDQIEIQLTRNTGVAQEFRLDNFQTLDTDLGGEDPGGGPSAVPEPTTMSMLIFILMIGMMLRRRLVLR